MPNLSVCDVVNSSNHESYAGEGPNSYANLNCAGLDSENFYEVVSKVILLLLN